ncbi:hypothetical protein [Streptomyces sp. CC53]|uniref:hypothetical protein n=1 Tax=unclassified Streptomyces TaxID=2593676 RepID=UPI003527174C
MGGSQPRGGAQPESGARAEGGPPSEGEDRSAAESAGLSAAKPAGKPPGKAGEGSGGSPLDEDAAWAAIVAAYGQEPPDPPGARPFRSVEDLALLEDDDPEGRDGDRHGGGDGGAPGGGKPAPGSSVVFAPGVGPAGPRDYELAEEREEDGPGPGGEGDEGHFVPPEPPPLPEADATTKFGWLGVVGGPVLMLLAVLLQWEMTWWLTTLCVVGFLGGFATLVARMKHGDDDEYDDPGRGAVV